MSGCELETECECEEVDSNSGTVQDGSFFRRQGDDTPSHYYASCTGCQFNIESCTSWQYWCTRSGPHRRQRVWVLTSGYVTVCGLRSATTTWLSEPFTSTAFAKRAFRCSAPATWNCLPKTVTNSNSLGTLSLHWSHLFSLIHTTFRQCLWSYNLMALYKSIIINVVNTEDAV